VDVLKIDIPADATPETPWVMTSLLRSRYYHLVPPKRAGWNESGLVGYQILSDEHYTPGTDGHTVRVSRKVSVTPLSLDLTSRISLDELDALLRNTD
jgi:5'-nucleotidase